MKRFAIGAALVLALAAAGCGGGGSKSLSRDEYAAQLTTICQKASAELKRIGTPTSPGEIVTRGPKLLDAFDGAIGQAEKLQPPDELRTAADKFVSEAKQIRGLIDRIVVAAKGNDLATLVQLGNQASALSKDLGAAGKSLGAPACALSIG